MVGALDPHVAAARSDVDPARNDRLPVDRFARRAPAGAPEMLGEYRREARRHVLGDQEGGPGNNRRKLCHHGV